MLQVKPMLIKSSWFVFWTIVGALALLGLAFVAAHAAPHPDTIVIERRHDLKSKCAAERAACLHRMARRKAPSRAR